MDSLTSGERATTPPASAALPALYFDCSDLIAHFAANRFPTGIQRVQMELFKAARAWAGATPISACAFTEDAAFWVDVDAGSFGALLTLASQPGTSDDEDWRFARHGFAGLIQNAEPLRFPPGAVLVNLGSSWWIDGYMPALRQARARYGVRYVPLVHDMIPLVTPAYVVPGMTAAFAAWAGSVFMHAEAVLATSASTARDIARFAGPVRALEHAPVIMPLDARFSDSSVHQFAAGRDAILDGFGLQPGGFVLFVATLEARKNHLLAFRGWSRLIEAEGAARVPALVCVGKPGWQFEPAQAYLDGHAELTGKVLLLQGVSDAELEALYAGCLFTLYPSHYEGWGLPVGESLSHGKICLAADNSSLPEVGGPFAAYFESDSLQSFVAQARRLMFDEDARRQGEARIAAEHRPRAWADVLAGLVEQLAVALAVPAAPPLAAPVAFGVEYRMGQREDLRQPNRAAAVAEMLRSHSDWHTAEPWGLWSRGRRVRLSLTLPEPTGPDEDVLVYLQLRTLSQPATLSLHAGGTRLASFDLPAARTTLVQATIPAALAWRNRATRALSLQIEAAQLTKRRPDDPDNSGVTGFGLASVTFAPAGDIAARLGVVERQAMAVAH